MTLHIVYEHQCPKCGAYYIPYDKNIPCPKCGVTENERFEYIPLAMKSLLFNLGKYGSYMPLGWWAGSFGDHILNILFHIFEGFRREEKQDNFDSFTRKFLSQMKWDDQDYLEKHIHSMAIRIHKELEKKTTSCV